MQALCGLLCCIRPRKEPPDPPHRPRAPNYPAPRPGPYLHHHRPRNHPTDSGCSSSSWSTYSRPRPRPTDFRAAPRSGKTPSPPGTSSQTTILPENLRQATASEYASSLPQFRQRNNSTASELDTVPAACESAVIEPAAWLSSSVPIAGSMRSVNNIHSRLRDVCSDAAAKTRSIELPFRMRARVEPELETRPVMRKESRYAKAADGRRARGWSDPELWAFYHFPDISRLPQEECGGSSEDELEDSRSEMGVTHQIDGEKKNETKRDVERVKETETEAKEENEGIKENAEPDNKNWHGKLHRKKDREHKTDHDKKLEKKHNEQYDGDSDKENRNLRSSISRASWAPTLLSYWSSSSSTAVEASDHAAFNHSSPSYPPPRHEEQYTIPPHPAFSTEAHGRPLTGETESSRRTLRDCGGVPPAHTLPLTGEIIRSSCILPHFDEAPLIPQKSSNRTLKTSESDSERIKTAANDARKNSLPDVELDTFLAGAVATAVKDGKSGKKKAKKAQARKETAVAAGSEAVKGRRNGNSTNGRRNSKIPVPKGKGGFGSKLGVSEVACE